MQKYFMLLIAAILILSCAACTQSDRQRLDAALSGDCPAKINALDVLLPELEDDAVRQEAERALLVCRTEIERVKVQQLFEEPEKNLEELLRMQIELKSAGRAGLIENAYNGFLSKLFAEGELERAEKLYKLLLKRGLLHATKIGRASCRERV